MHLLTADVFIFRSHIGKAILSQPACVSKLLSLLLDQRPSPKLVLIILQLCRAALPLMSVEDCGNVALPSWSYSMNTLDAEQQDANDPASRIAALLLAKLADYVVPGKSDASTMSLSETVSNLVNISVVFCLMSQFGAELQQPVLTMAISFFLIRLSDAALSKLVRARHQPVSR